MTKRIITAFLLCFLFITITAQTSGDGNSITFTTEYVNHGSQLPTNPKSPVIPPQVSIGGNMLYFTGTHAEFVLTLTDEDGEVVFTTVIYDTDTQAMLPSSLSGTFELRLYTGIYCFVGEITL